MADYANDVLVEPEWLEQHLNDDSIRIVEVDENPALYQEAHIPGAIGFDWRLDLQDQVKRDFLGPEDFGALFGSRGISDDHQVDPLRRPQQLVRRLHLLVPEVLRARRRQAAQRPPRDAGSPRGARRPTEPPAYAPQRRSRRSPATTRSAPSATRSSPRSTTPTQLVDVRSPQEYSGELIAMPGYEQRGRAARRPHPQHEEHPLGPGGQGGRHVQAPGEELEGALRRQGRGPVGNPVIA